MITKAALSAALIALRKRCGLTQAELARRAGFTPQFASRIESRRGRIPDFSTIIRYGKACGTSVGLLFARANERQLTLVASMTLQAPNSTRHFESVAGESLARKDERDTLRTMEAKLHAAAIF